ncbi:pyruvate kinase [Thermoplasma sp.]|uniref:pyruvate kinase n=1 Tax=Thermoplasma sp. TaxID=1973142 RepID=UPI0012704F1B|nr:pyruvate kinase [Thermoplasma sp.]KAA8923141.1 MAG: pyruvate kinase [Thermoplasma sp.]
MKTKIVATIGPASSSQDVMKGMIENGLSLVRINSAHADIRDVSSITKMVRSLNKDVGIMIDLKGPELRTGEFPGGSLKIASGKEYIMGRDIVLNNMNALSTVQVGDRILMSDGEVTFEVESTDPFTIKALNDGVLRDRSRVNIPGRFIELGTITDRDRTFIKEGIADGVDFFALSFVQRADNVDSLRDFVMDSGGDQYIISKIETKSGLDNIVDIVKSSDGIMVARGDLGVELPLKEVVLAQKHIIKTAHEDGDFTIVATQVLESMVNNSSPTRAEISDITNAIIDNADALMLSEESAIGKYPVQAVRTLKEVSDYVEERVSFDSSYYFKGNTIAYSVARAAKILSDDIKSDGIVALTHTGSTVRMISSLRPKAMVYAATVSDSLARKLNIYFGVSPLHMEGNAENLSFSEIMDYIVGSGRFSDGSKLVMTSGDPYFTFGGTNDVKVAVVGKFIGRGYSFGESLSGTATYTGNGDILVADDGKTPNGDFKGYIFTSDIRPSLMSSIKGKTVVTKARLVRRIQEGERIYIDGNTGIILTASINAKKNSSR